MTGSDFINLAEILTGSRDEQSLRSAVSRAYYGAFHHCREFLEAIQRPVPRNSTAHVQIARQLLRSRHPDACRAGSLLADLHSDRIKADYQLDFAPAGTTRFAQRSVKIAREIQAAVDLCHREPARSEIQSNLPLS